MTTSLKSTSGGDGILEVDDLIFDGNSLVAFKADTTQRGINVKSSPYNAQGDGVTDDTQAFKDALAAGKLIRVPKGVYIISDTLELDEHHLIGDGVDKWVPAFPDQAKEEAVGTNLRFVGTGTKRYEVKDTTDMKLAGGWRTNGSTANSEDQFYKLLNFMNTDASGSTPATTKKVSAAIYVKPTSQNWSIKGLRIYPSYNGLDGYNQKLSGLADDWDVGLFANNVEFGITDNFQSVGYWRTASLLLSHARTDAGQFEAGSEHNKFVRSMFQGFRGVSIRGGDYFRVTAVTSTTIEIPWTPSNPVPAQSNLMSAIGLRIGSATFQWTGSTQSGDKLTLTGVTPDPTANGVSVGTVLRNNIYSSGLAGTNFQDCYICGLEHFTSKPSDELGLGLGVSCAIEANNTRGVRITGSTKIATREQVLMFLLESDDWEISGDIEPASWVKADETAGNTGGRIIATPLNVVDAQVLYPAGNTNKFNIFSDYYSTFTDLEPYYTRTNTRFSDAGLFDPRELFIKSKALPSSDVGAVLRGSKKQGVRFQTEDGTDVLVMFPSGSLTARTNLNLLTGVLSTDSSSTSMTFRTGTTSRLNISSASGNFFPTVDNTQSFGTSSNRISEVFAGTGTINTSDRNEKQDISNIPDAVLDAWAKVNYQQFRFKDAVIEKGEESRLHIGLIAQDIHEAFQSHGLDAFRYGILCYDEWSSEEATYDSEGNVINPARESGSLWGIRADECQFLEMALMRREMQKLKSIT